MQNEISLAKFLARYCNMAGKDLSRMTHDDVEVMLPELKRTSFELVEKKPELLAQGIVLLVNDGFRTIPYLAPRLEFEEDPMEVTVLHEKPKKAMIPSKRTDYTRMNIYELRCLLRNKFSSCAVKRRARMELQDRGVVLSRKYNRMKEKQKIERDKNEGY